MMYIVHRYDVYSSEDKYCKIKEYIGNVKNQIVKKCNSYEERTKKTNRK